MKKRTLLAVFAALTLGACTLGMAACGGGADSTGGLSGSGSSATDSTGGGSGEAEEPWTGEVTEAEWNAFPFAADATSYLTGNDNYTYRFDVEYMGDIMSTMIMVEGRKYVVGDVGTDGTFLAKICFESNGEIDPENDSFILGTKYDRFGDAWTVAEGRVSFNDVDANMPGMGLSELEYAVFEYDAANGFYNSTESINAGGTEVAAGDVTVTFAADGSVQIRLIVPSGEEYMYVTCKISSVGVTTVTLPAVA